MACNEKTLLLLSRYANGEATANEAARAGAHAESCADCREVIDEWQGQRQLLVWASTLELPELSPDKLREIAQREEPMSVPQRPSRRIAWPRVRINLAYSSATIAAVITLGLVTMYASRNALFTPRLPDGTTLGSANQVVRVRNGVVLELAPNTRVTRLGDYRIRLDAGWLRATVRHGSGLRILTKRLDVRDVGTVFQMNAGPSTDSVTVEEGKVSVSRDGTTYPVRHQQILVASDKGPPVLGAFPAYEPEEDAPGQPLANNKDAFSPQSGDSLDWDEGLTRLAAAFPNARSGGTSGSRMTWHRDDSAFRLSFAIAKGTRRGMRAHFAEIARAQSGATSNIGTWAFPVAYLKVDDVADPQGLRPDAYQVEMFANGASLFWRFKGSRGIVVDTPVTFERRPKWRRGSISGGTSVSGAGNIEEIFVDESGQSTATAYYRLVDWPGAMKPTLRLELKPLAGYGGDERAMKAELVRRTAGVPGLKLEEGPATMLYLDPGRSRRVMIAWNTEAGRQLEDVLDGGSTGAVVMGTITTEEPCLKPRLPAGTYLLRWVRPSSSQPPHWEIATLDGRSAMVLPTPSRRERKEQENAGGSSSGQSLWHSKENEQLNVSLKYSQAESGSFTFRFSLSNESVDPPKWGEGWLRVKQP